MKLMKVIPLVSTFGLPKLTAIYSEDLQIYGFVPREHDLDTSWWILCHVRFMT